MLRKSRIPLLALGALLAACEPPPAFPGAVPQPAVAVDRRTLLGGELPVDAPVAVAQLSGDQVEPAIAWGNGEWLVAWRDYRGGETPDVYAARVSAQGALLDPAGIPICTAIGDQFSVEVAFDGVNWLVTWLDARNPLVLPFPNPPVYAARVTPGGTVLDPDGVPVAFPIQASQARLTFDGQNYVAVWDQSSPAQISAVTLSADASVLGAPWVVAQGNLNSPSVASAGDGLMFQWRSMPDADVNIRTLDDAGTLGPPVRLGNTAVGEPGVPLVSNGSGYLASWSRSGSLFARPLLADGTPVLPSASVISASLNPFSTYHLSAAGSDYAAIWPQQTASGNAAVSVVFRDGGVGPPFAVLPRFGESQDDPSLSCADAGCLVAWESGVPGALELHFERLLLPSTLLSDGGPVPFTGWNRENAPVAATDGVRTLLAWIDSRTGEAGLYAALLDRAGTVLAPGVFAIAAPLGSTDHAAIDFGGGSFLISWRSVSATGTTLFARRLSPSGAWLDAAPIVLSGAPIRRSPAVAHDATSWVVAWSAYVDQATADDLFLARVSFDGGLLGPGPVGAISQPNWQDDPVLVAADGGFLLGWRDNRYPGVGVLAARVAQDLTVLDDGGFPVQVAGSFVSELAAATDGTHALFVWQDLGSNLTTAVVSGPGAVGPFTLLRPAPRRTRRPTAVFDGREYVVAWDDDNFPALQVLGNRLTSAGVPVYDGGVVLTSGNVNHQEVALSPLGPGRTTAAYAVFDPTAQSLRLHTRSWVDVPLGGACTQGAECRVGSCSIGFCCLAGCGGAGCVCGQDAGGDAGPSDGGGASDGGKGDGGGGLPDGGLQGTDAGRAPGDGGVRGALTVGCASPGSSGPVSIAVFLAGVLLLRPRRRGSG